MGGLARTLEEILYIKRSDGGSVIDTDMLTRLRSAQIMELHYTMRQKGHDEMVTALRCNGATEAIIYRESDDGSEVAHDVLRNEAQSVSSYLKKKISDFDVQFVGYYMWGNLQKQKFLGRML